MVDFVKLRDMVEGAKCEVYARKQVVKGMYKDPITQKPMLKYELSRNCSVEVSKALDFTEDERLLRDSMFVHYSVGDKIKGDSITLYLDQKRPVKFEVKEGLTSRHGGHLLSTDKRTIGVIKYTFDNLTPLLKDDFRQLLPNYNDI